MTSFIDYINNSVINLPIYFNSHMRIVEQIIPKCFHVFINDYGAYKANSSFVSLHISFRSGRNAKDNIYRL
jgi:hypothetical protein